jgi:hypothetical protein
MNTCRTLTRAALVAAALAAGSAGAQDRNHNGVYDQGDRGVVTPSVVEQTPSFDNGIPAGRNAIPSTSNPQNPNEAKPFVQQPEGVRPLVRSDNPNLPKPVTPSAANESAPQPELRDPTNMSGMERAPVGATR